MANSCIVKCKICPDHKVLSKLSSSQENCIETIKTFYDFKQRCIEVEKSLQIMIFSPSDPLPPNCITCASEIDTVVKSDQPETIQSLNVNCTEQKQCSNDVTSFPIKLSTKRKKYNKIPTKHQCETCGKIFKGLKTLNNHILTHCGFKEFSCKLCLKNFARKENLNIHMRSHLGIRPFICDICGKSSTKRQDLIRHFKIHSEDRDYVCMRCNCTFKRSSDVVRHMRTHTGERPYSCNDCDKHYASHSGLKKHLKAHSDNL
ncbi:hypothetical protein K1T71_002774 [Dendrolimus kikuchii]|uniref:Uncharacterized protein n=1 Tax=Dendrolimus kikuchii TaxID=765133 RepID=A0ACC1DEM6_9NEOP|nr:hypothetical protein K1T71_002774 [Dendrolimus kikuchii]